MNPGDRVEVAFSPHINEYRGWRSVQLQITDLRPALTRCQRERAVYDKFQRGEALTPREASLLLPSREEFVVLWRYLKARSGVGLVEESPRRMTRNLSRDCGHHAPFQRTMICLKVFDERGLIHLECRPDALRISFNQVEGKVDLNESYILRRLRQMMDS